MAPAEDVDPLVGQVLDEAYLIEERLGGGGFGTVYRARQVALGRSVALEVIRGEWKGKLDMALRFDREAKLLSRLEHPNTIRIYDFGQTDDGQLYLAMELYACLIGPWTRVPIRLDSAEPMPQSFFASPKTKRITSLIDGRRSIGYIVSLKPARVLF